MDRGLGAAKLIDLIDDVSCMTMHINPEESGRLSPNGRCKPGINASIHTNQLAQDIGEVPVYLRNLVAQSGCLV
jgi:hypothetical protein